MTEALRLHGADPTQKGATMPETTTVHAYATQGPNQPFEPFEYELGPIQPDEVEIEVSHCGICHSDLSMANNDWGLTSYPFVGGHEVEGTVAKLGSEVTHLAIGDRVGVGWFAHSDTTCPQCVAGHHNLSPTTGGTIVGRHGGFADRMRAQAVWTFPIDEGIPVGEAGPLFCGGGTVFTPLKRYAHPTNRVGVVGIGGLGHMALKFARSWGCHVTAITSSASKEQEARDLGAHEVVMGRDASALEAHANSLDLLISTVNVSLDWSAYIALLKPNGRLHLVGAALEPIPIAAFDLIMGQRSISGSPVANPTDTTLMVDFAARHAIAPMNEHFPLSELNQAMKRLAAGDMRYRAVLDV